MEHVSDNDEPEGTGWVTAPTLLDTVITSITLCRFSGVLVGLDGACPIRAAGRHEDLDCRSLYLQAEALATGGVVDQTLFGEAQEVIRIHAAGDDVVGTIH